MNPAGKCSWCDVIFLPDPLIWNFNITKLSQSHDPFRRLNQLIIIIQFLHSDLVSWLHFLHSILCPCVFLWYIWRKPLHYANIMSEEVPQLCPCTYFSPIITFSISVHWSLKEEIKTNRQNVVFSIFLGSSLMRSICEIYLDCKYVTLRIHGNNPLVYCSAATALTWAEILCNQ